MSAWRELGVHTEIKLLANAEIAVIESTAPLAGWSIIPQVESVFGVDLVNTQAMSTEPEGGGRAEFRGNLAQPERWRRHHQSSGGRRDRRALGLADPIQRSRRLIRH
jgi:hypothetical protein